MKYFYFKTIFAIFALIVMLQGCVPYFVNIKNIDEVNIQDINSTNLIGFSKQQLINQFGPPLAVAKKNGPPLYFPRAFKEGSDRYESVDVLKKFSSKHTIGDHHFVFCYQQTIMSGGGIVFVVQHPLPIVATSDTVYNLWLLLDERTQKVIDFIVEKIQ